MGNKGRVADVRANAELVVLYQFHQASWWLLLWRQVKPEGCIVTWYRIWQWGWDEGFEGLDRRMGWVVVLLVDYRNSIVAQRGAWDILDTVLWMKLWQLVCSVWFSPTFWAETQAEIAFHLPLSRYTNSWEIKICRRIGKIHYVKYKLLTAYYPDFIIAYDIRLINFPVCQNSHNTSPENKSEVHLIKFINILCTYLHDSRINYSYDFLLLSLTTWS